MIEASPILGGHRDLESPVGGRCRVGHLDVSDWSSNAAVTYRLEPLRS
jgi:hypothetical protein